MQIPPRKSFYAYICTMALVIVTGSRVFAEETSLECRVVYDTNDGIYVDAGSEAGLKRGSVIRVEYEGLDIGKAEVVNVTKDSTFLKLATMTPGRGPSSGDRVTLFYDHVPAAGGDDSDNKEASPTLKQDGQDKEFTPLLAPPDMAELASTDAANLMDGRLTVRQLFQIADDDDLNYFKTHFRTSGSVERLNGTPWVLEWSADLSYRDGDALERTRDFQDLRLEVYRLALYRRFDDRSFVRFGRFIPRELPSVGFLDGVQGEKVVNEHLRLGAMLGFKPTRDDLNMTVDEPTVVPYVTFELGERQDVYYTGTAGVLASLFRGDPDRLAILVDQTADIGQLSLFASSEVDFDVGGFESRNGVRLTRADFLASYPVFSWMTARVGLDRYERVDTEAERQIIREGFLLEEDFFDRGFWRYWAGPSIDLPLNLNLRGEASFTDAPDNDYLLRWQGSLTRTGLPFVPRGSITVTVYNLEGRDLEGYGGRVTGYLPVTYRLSLQPSVAIRMVETDDTEEEFDFTDVSLRANWLLSDSWTLFGGVAYAFSDDVDRAFIDIGITFRW